MYLDLIDVSNVTGPKITVETGWFQTVSDQAGGRGLIAFELLDITVAEGQAGSTQVEAERRVEDLKPLTNALRGRAMFFSADWHLDAGRA